MERRLGPAKDASEYSRKAQFLNYEGMRAMFESFVANRYGSTGVIQWMFNSAWPKLWWQLYDYYLMPNGALYGARKAGEPLHILYNYGTREIVVTNNTREEAAKLRAEIRILDIELREKYAKTVEITVGADQVYKLDDLPVPDGLSTTYFVDLRLFEGKNSLVDTNFYCLSTKAETLDEEAATWYVTPVRDYADFTALDELKPAKLRIKDKFSTEGSVTRASLEIENTSKNLAFFIELNIRRSETDEVVLPVFWDDNYITLLPGEKRRIGGAFYTDDLLGEKPVLRVKGWNIEG
jgi:exo-1,4-beta-D-glucosaminidase